MTKTVTDNRPHLVVQVARDDRHAALWEMTQTCQPWGYEALGRRWGTGGHRGQGRGLWFWPLTFYTCKLLWHVSPHTLLIDVWVSEWVSEGVSVCECVWESVCCLFVFGVECVSECVSEWVSEWVSVCWFVCIWCWACECVNPWVCK